MGVNNSNFSIMENLQDFLFALGQNGCYCLCLAEIAKCNGVTFTEIVDGIESSIRKGYLEYHSDDKYHNDNFTVKYPALILFEMTGLHWGFSLERPEKSEYDGVVYDIECWARRSGEQTFTHFRLPGWDSYPSSKCHRFGFLQSHRFLYLKKSK